MKNTMIPTKASDYEPAIQQDKKFLMDEVSRILNPNNKEQGTAAQPEPETEPDWIKKNLLTKNREPPTTIKCTCIPKISTVKKKKKKKRGNRNQQQQNYNSLFIQRNGHRNECRVHPNIK